MVNLETRLEGFVFVAAVGMWATLFALSKRSGMSTGPSGSGLSAGFAGSPQALTVQIDPVGVMDQAVEHGVGVGGVADQRMPLVDGVSIGVGTGPSIGVQKGL